MLISFADCPYSYRNLNKVEFAFVLDVSGVTPKLYRGFVFVYEFVELRC